jgi:Arc/MetJ-type ribon-helix-helix transcriptional regulator
MRRITISLEDALVALAEAEVASGRAPSVSAWVASAIRAKAQARAELIADLEELERRDPTGEREIAAIASTLGLPISVVTRAMNRGPSQARTRTAS